jgi:hypothetical protein
MRHITGSREAAEPGSVKGIGPFAAMDETVTQFVKACDGTKNLLVRADLAARHAKGEA